MNENSYVHQYTTEKGLKYYLLIIFIPNMTPIVERIEVTSVTIQAIDGYEYKCGNDAWKKTIFTNLVLGQRYTFFQRVAESDIFVERKQSPGLPVTTFLKMYTIRYDSNGGKNAPSTQEVGMRNEESISVMISNAIPTCKGYIFKCICKRHGLSKPCRFYLFIVVNDFNEKIECSICPNGNQFIPNRNTLCQSLDVCQCFA